MMPATLRTLFGSGDGRSDLLLRIQWSFLVPGAGFEPVLPVNNNLRSVTVGGVLPPPSRSSPPAREYASLTRR